MSKTLNLDRSLWLIVFITSKGDWHYCNIILNNNNSQEFIMYIEFNELANKNFTNSESGIALLLDNCLIHHSKSDWNI